MSPRLLIMLAAAAILAGLVAWDFGQRAAKPVAPAPAPTAETLSPALERPLFAPSRRPPVVAPAGQTEQAAAQNFRLLGVAMSDGVSIAVIEADGARVRLKRGQAVAGWRLVEVGPRRAVLINGETRRVLTF